MKMSVRFVLFFLCSVTTVSYAQDCQVIGESCQGALFAGEFQGDLLFTTPGNCTDEKEAKCDGSKDSKLYKWAAQTGIVTGATDLNDGRVNVTKILASKHTETQSVTFCDQLVYAGHNDWYLPAQNELLHLYQHKKLLKGFNSSGFLYGTSTEINQGIARMIKFRDGTLLNGGKPSVYLVRCVRREKKPAIEAGL